MSAFNPRKRWAVWVVIAWLATAISVWAFEIAGNKALAEPVCKTCKVGDTCTLADLKKKVPEIELEDRQPKRTVEILPSSSTCAGRWIEARTKSDFLLIPSYSALMAFIFLLLRAPRKQGDRPAGLSWVVVGVLLALGMLGADSAENVLLLQAIVVPCRMDAEALRLLWTATATKWGTVALASALAGVLALIRSTGWVTRVAGLLGLVTSGVLALGLYQAMKDPANIESSKALLNETGPLWLAAFFFAALIHAVIVIVKPDPLHIEPTPEGESKP